MARKYNAKYRRLKALMRDLKRTLELADKPVREGRPRRVRRAENRSGELPRDRKCPVCKELKLKSRQWVVKHGIVCCVSCYRIRTNFINEVKDL